MRDPDPIGAWFKNFFSGLAIFAAVFALLVIPSKLIGYLIPEGSGLLMLFAVLLINLVLMGIMLVIHAANAIEACLFPPEN